MVRAATQSDLEDEMNDTLEAERVLFG